MFPRFAATVTPFDRLAYQFILGVPEHAGDGLIDRMDGASGVDDDNTVYGGIKNGLQSVFHGALGELETGPFQENPDALSDDHPVEGFGEKFIHSGGEGVFDGGGRVGAGDHDDGKLSALGQGAEFAAGFKTVHFWHDGVQNDHVREGGLQAISHRLPTVCDPVGVVSQAQEKFNDEFAGTSGVVGDENRRIHDWRLEGKVSNMGSVDFSMPFPFAKGK